MFELLSIPKKPYHFVRLNASFRSLTVVACIFHTTEWHQPATPLQSTPSSGAGASGSVSCGAVYPPFWLQHKWGDSPYTGVGSNQEDSITFQELLPIIFACAVLGPRWQNAFVVVQCDNQGAVTVVNSGYSKVQPIMHLLCCLFFNQSRYNISLHAVHLPGRYIVLVHAISRDNLSFFFSV